MVAAPKPIPTITLAGTISQTDELELIEFTPGNVRYGVSGYLEGTRSYVFYGFADQVITISVLPMGTRLSLRGEDGTTLKNADDGFSFWRGALPVSQNYFIEIRQDWGGDYDLSVVALPVGQSVRWFDFREDTYGFELEYPDYFVPDWSTGLPLTKGAAVYKLNLVDTKYFQGTNLSAVSFLAGTSDDPSIVRSCTHPVSGNEETLGDETVGVTTFRKSALADRAMSNVHEQIIYRTIYQSICYEMVFSIQYTDLDVIDPSSGITAFDREAILGKLEEILATLQFVDYAPIPFPTSFPSANPTLIPGWTTFVNEHYRFAFDYPGQFFIEFRQDWPDLVGVHMGSGKVFYISATNNFQPGDVNIFFDTAPTGQRVLGKYTWNTFVIPEGYGGPVGVSVPVYVLQMEADGKLYSIVFHYQQEISPLQELIVSRFRLFE